MTLVVNHHDERPATVDAGEVLSDVMQADALILFDRRGALLEQLSVHGMTRAEAASKLRECAAALGQDPAVDTIENETNPDALDRILEFEVDADVAGVREHTGDVVLSKIPPHELLEAVRRHIVWSLEGDTVKIGGRTVLLTSVAARTR